MNENTCWKQRVCDLDKAVTQLADLLAQPQPNEYERAHLVQYFDYTYELACKTMKGYLEAEGYVVKGIRMTIERAIEIGLIVDGDIWIESLGKRGLMLAYNEKLTHEAEALIRSSYAAMFKNLLVALQEKRRGTVTLSESR